MKSRIKYWFLAVCLGCLPLVALAFLPRPAAAAGVWYVATGGSDANDCQTAVTPCKTINGAAGKAAAGDTIKAAMGVYTASTGSEVVLITRSTTLLGGWDGSFVNQIGESTVDAESLRRGARISGSGAVKIDRFIFQRGQTDNGGGIYTDGHLSLERSQVISNAAGSNGGGIYNGGYLTVTRSLISNNTGTLNGGGVATFSGTAKIQATTISNNTSGTPEVSGGGGGAGVYLDYDDAMEIWDSTIANNRMLGQFDGVGIYSSGALTIVNSTISGNWGDNSSAMFTFVSTLFIYNSTISGNSGYGIRNIQSQATIRNSIMVGAEREDRFTDHDGYTGVTTSYGHNLFSRNNGCALTNTDLVGTFSGLDKLRDNGGPAATQALLSGSPAIDGGDPGGCAGPAGVINHDERGYARLGRCDIGAFEAQALDLSDKTVNQASAVPGQHLQFTVHVNNIGSSPIASVTMTDALPSGLTYIDNSLTASGGSAGQLGGVITWTGVVSAGTSVTIQFYAASLPSASLGTVITNTAVITGGGHGYVRQAAVTLRLAKLFLPLIAKPLGGIQGYVTLNGAPAQGVPLELRKYDGQSFSTQSTTNTDGQGFYNFAAAPSLAPGEIYYVRYLNTAGTPGQLWFWGTADITSYTAGGTVAGNFDVADVALVSPVPGAQVGLPALFEWVRRPATPSDSYTLSLFEPSGSANAETALLGYVNGVNLTGLPGEFHTGTTYGWSVNIYSPDGGFGSAYYYREVSFSSLAARSQESIVGGAVLEAAKLHVDSARP